MRSINRDEYFLPSRIVQTASDKHALPFVQKARVQIQLAVHEFEDVKRRPFPDS